MKKTLFILIILTVLTMVLFAAPKSTPTPQVMDRNSDHPGMMMGAMDGRGNMKGMAGMASHQAMMKELDLSKDQTNKIETLMANHMKMMNTKKAELQNLMIDKKIAMKAEMFDQVKNINKNIADLRLMMDNAKVDNHAAMLRLLTPEQREKMMQMMPMQGGMGMGMGMKGGMGMGNGMGMCSGMGMCNMDDEEE